MLHVIDPQPQPQHHCPVSTFSSRSPHTWRMPCTATLRPRNDARISAPIAAGVKTWSRIAKASSNGGKDNNCSMVPMYRGSHEKQRQQLVDVDSALSVSTFRCKSNIVKRGRRGIRELQYQNLVRICIKVVSPVCGLFLQIIQLLPSLQPQEVARASISCG